MHREDGVSELMGEVGRIQNSCASLDERIHTGKIRLREKVVRRRESEHGGGGVEDFGGHEELRSRRRRKREV